MTTTEKVIIIGSGPAGHTAAIYTARANLQPLMFEGFIKGGSPGGQLITTTEIENFPGFPEGISGPELMGALKKQSERFGTQFITEDVDAVDLSSHPFKVSVAQQDYFTLALIIATGASARYLGLESEKRLLNRGVSACATCDGALPMFRNRDLIVVGGGDTAMEEANYLTRFASTVWLVHRREEFRASKTMQDRTRKNPKISLLTSMVVEEILGDDQVSGIRLRHVVTNEVITKPVAGVFIAIGHQPNTSIFSGQLELDDVGYIKTKGNSSYTSVAGVFAAGDVKDHVYRQAITAAGSGCQAAIDAERWLES
ncbi:MAG: thioredoxin-disulfide reductase [Deltaproteobacteria bacterium]|nr:thioredoxin-disulfide reductase [Deltaproteobacteria bacterium]